MPSGRFVLQSGGCNMFSRHLQRLTVLQACLAAPSLFAIEQQPPPIPDDPTKGIRPISAKPTDYVKKWALVIGTNYSSTSIEGFSKLNHAENDAIAFNNLLIGKFGYQKENVILLTGSNATHEAITQKLREH